ncbi:MULTISPECIES: hypothetical protein [unclassified Paenibacillus]|uniref:immunity protein TriTu family protein n=1 Tax=unclassified Paenibacillus TaxID=185978 RepID=UPI002789952B|nr:MULTISPECIES: hypothetical protein [unclassified Paenibacillus]MDQ0899385.1 hypothetical protein [Paenibacillus sp. V4I7]MDQ0914562.1 hypothetical protein [Paenibacillus sp. V4I5]
MIRDKFKLWVESNKSDLAYLSISTEYVKHNTPESSVPDPSTGIINESERCLGQVTVWESAQMEYEVVHIATEEMLLWRYIEKLPAEPNFDEILAEYFHVLQTGLKPDAKKSLN